ncbi:glycosyltransferase family 9 protein [Nocardioides sp. Arc9.136]|uniref:glycosyltransferase family 9 protein n=1 Tax=Nocardioides sp. Arc9.136 TaxID=2996826 RepID=UPI0026669F8F|nr:glycosyltransferase family 9 protein [Nocardioides sp. Arc9.136]WKN46749.1 glycosyltransferase family 9 protein [Nocardioides sp. Arc9.136]
MSPGRPRALVLRAIGLGDHLAGVPALKALRRALPDHELVLAAPAPLAPLVALVPAVDTHLPVAELAPVPWTGPPPDVAVDLHGNGPASRRLLEDLGPGRLVAYETADGPRWDPEEHERARWCRLVRTAFALLPTEADPDDVSLDAPPAAPQVAGAVVVHPGAAYPGRRWPPVRFAQVTRALAAEGHRVVVTGSAAEAPLAEEVRRAAGLPAEAVLAGRTDLGGLAALVAAARLVVCGDTGTAHLASAYATPSVLLFGPTPPHRWGPPARGPHTVLWHGTGPGDPHATELDPALAAIGVEEVLEACRVRLSRAGSARRPSTAPSG